MSIRLMTDLELRDQRVLIRADLNVPIKDSRVTSDTRIVASVPTIRRAVDANARVMVTSHLGRPTEGTYDDAFSLAPVANHLASLLRQPVRLIKHWLDGVDVDPGEVAVLENVRFNTGEKKNDDALARKMAALCDVFVMDAFGTAHRAQASTYGVAKFAATACAGPLLAAELDALGKALQAPKHPVVAVVGGSKVSTKLEVLRSLIKKVDSLIVGGGIANNFIAAAGYTVGRSLMEPDLVDVAGQLLATAKQRGSEIPIPSDVVVSPSLDGPGAIKPVNKVGEEDMILDIGPKTSQLFARQLQDAGTIVWNGPVGVFEIDAFAAGTRAVAQAIADSPAFSIAGGGDTLAAMDKFGVANAVSYASTGGGAFLEFLEGKKLPAVEILETRGHE